MKKLGMAALITALLLSLFTLCAMAEPVAGLRATREEPLQYAKEFQMTHYEEGYISFTLNMQEGKTFLLVPEGKQAPQDLDKSVVVLQMPITRMTFNSSGMVSLLDAIQGLDHLATVGTESKGWHLPEMKKRMADDRILYSGNSREPDFEMLSQANIQVGVDTWRLLEQPELIQKYEELNMPWLIESSSKEGHPLGRVEWVKLFGAMIGKLPHANAYFDEQVKKVEAVAHAEKTGKTVAMIYISSDGSKVYCRNGGDYMATMIGMAGGEYIMKDLAPEKTGTTAVTMESFFAACRDADYLFFFNLVQKFKKLEDMRAYNEVLPELKAVKNGNVYITSPDFTQSTAAIAGIIEDMHTVMLDSGVTETHSLIKLR